MKLKFVRKLEDLEGLSADDFIVIQTTVRNSEVDFSSTHAGIVYENYENGFSTVGELQEMSLQ